MANSLQQISMSGKIGSATINKDIESLMAGSATVYILLDTSSSMGYSLSQAMSGARNFASQAVERGYSCGLICFNDDSRVAVEATKDMAIFDRCLKGFEAWGGTAMDKAILSSLNYLRGDGTKVICIVTDGFPNYPGATIDAAVMAKKRGVEIMAIGTEDADNEFLARIVTKTTLCRVVKTSNLGCGITGMARSLPPIQMQSKSLSRSAPLQLSGKRA